MVLGTFGGVRGLAYMTTAAIAASMAPAAAAQDAQLQAQTPQGRSVTLNVRASGSLRCMTVAIDGETPRRTAPCETPSTSPARDVRALHVVYRSAPERLAILYGIASARTAELHVTFADGRGAVLRPQTSERAYLLPLAGRARVTRVLAYDNRGTLQGAFDYDPRGVPAARGPFTLFGTTDERGGRALVTAFTARLYRENSTRRALHACMAISARRDIPTPNAEPGYSGGFACTTSRRRILVRYAAGCDARRLLLYGLAPTAVRRLTLITGAGERLPVRMSAFPRRMRRSGRAFVVSRRDLGRLARLDAYDAKGERLASVSLSGTGSGCGSSSRS